MPICIGGLSKGRCHWQYRKQIPLRTFATFATWEPMTTINLLRYRIHFILFGRKPLDTWCSHLKLGKGTFFPIQDIPAVYGHILVSSSLLAGWRRESLWCLLIFSLGWQQDHQHKWKIRTVYLHSRFQQDQKGFGMFWKTIPR